MKPKTLEEWKKQFETILFKDLLITPNDCTDEREMELEFKNGSSPQSFVDYIAEKYGLEKI